MQGPGGFDSTPFFYSRKAENSNLTTPQRFRAGLCHRQHTVDGAHLPTTDSPTARRVCRQGRIGARCLYLHKRRDSIVCDRRRMWHVRWSIDLRSFVGELGGLALRVIRIALLQHSRGNLSWFDSGEGVWRSRGEEDIPNPVWLMFRSRNNEMMAA
jgi:hypothetical protein